MKINIQKILLGAVALVIALAMGLSYYAGKKSAPGVDTKLITALQDSLRVSRDSAGKETAKRLQLESDAKSLNALIQNQNGLLKGKDEQIKRLMKATPKTNDATYVVTDTEDSVTSAPVTVDTVAHEYRYLGWDKWFQYDVTAGPEHIKLNYKTHNEFVVKHERVKNGIETTVTNLNPNTSTKEIISYTTQIPKPKRFSVGPVVGVGVNTINPTKPSVFVGVGVTYSLIRF